jgi:hypothetical protein
MDTTRRYIVFLALVLSAGVAYGQSDPPAKDPPFAERLRGLEAKNEKTQRLQTLQWLNQKVDEQNAALAAAALERCIREDPEGEVRQRAVAALCHWANRLGRPCPLAVIRALSDSVDEVRWEAAAWAAVFKTFAPGSTEVLLHGVTADKAELRSTSLLLLARAAGKDPKALEAMEKATEDKVFDVRHSAHLALFRARDRLDEHLPYLIRIREDPASVLTPGPADSEVAKEERAQRNLFLLTIAMQVMEWSESRADELAGVLMKLLDDKSAVMRRGAANLIAASVNKVELPAQRPGDPLGLAGMPKDGWASSILPYIDPEGAAKREKDARPAERPQKSKVARCLEKLQVDDRLRKMGDNDPDRSVREAARHALEQLAGLSEKKP